MKGLRIDPGRFPPGKQLPRHFLEGRPELFPAVYPSDTGSADKTLTAVERWRASRTDRTPHASREELTGILLRQNRALDCSEETVCAIETLKQPDTVAVVTGQQAGFLGGPLYTLYKALGAIRVARELSRSGIPAVAVFWIAGDDHDYEEIRRISFLSRHTRVIESFELPQDPEGEGLPVAARHPAALTDQQVETLRRHLGDSGGFLQQGVEDYRQGRSLVEGFGRLMTRLLGPFGLIQLDPTDREMKSLTTPLIVRYLDRLDSLETALREREHHLLQAGYHLQVQARPGHSGLFLLDSMGRRRALFRTDEGETAFRPAGGVDASKRFDLPTLAMLAREEPWRFSGSALTRCLFQDYLLPASAYIAGPGEVSYLAQSMSLYPLLDLPLTTVIHRPSFTLLEPPVLRFLEKHGVPLEAMLLDPERVGDDLIRSHPSAGILEDISLARDDVLAAIDRLESAVTGVDPTLSGPVSRLRGGSVKGLDTVRRKLENALKRKESELFGAFERSLMSLLPLGKPQERQLGWICYIGKYGPQLAERLLDEAEPFSGAHLAVSCE